MIAAAILPDDALLFDAARQARAQHLHLVITRSGTVVLTPILLPGMVKIAQADRQSHITTQETA